MTVDVTFPSRIKYTSERPSLAGQVRGRRRSINNAETIIPSFGPYWRVTASFFASTDEERLEWDAFISQMNGGIGQTAMPLFVPIRPLDARGRVIPLPEAPAIPAAEHWSIVNDPDFTRVALSADAALRATDLRLDLIDCEGIRPGHLLSLGNRLYRVQTAWNSGRNIRVYPPLREAHSAGTKVEVDQPLCLVRLASEGEGDVTFLPNGIYQMTVDFTEALDVGA